MIEVKQVFGGYEGHSVIEDVSLKVEKGEFFALLGPNGSGKSTLLKMLTGVLPLQKGEIHLAGQPLQAYSSLERARRVTVLEQEEHIAFDFSVEEIVALGRYPHQQGFLKTLSVKDREMMKEAMKLTNIWQYRHTPFRRLSGGEKQRVLLAKALAQDPRILFLDEPTNHLDLQHAFQMLSLLKEWQQSRQLTVFAILHDLNTASLYADRVALLQSGKLVDVGAVQLLKKEERLEKVYQVEVTYQTHPQIPKPQFLLTPRHDQQQSASSFSNQYEVRQKKRLLHVHFDHPLKTLSNSVWGSGLQWASHFCNFHVPKHYDCSHPQKDIRQWLSEWHIPEEQAIGMMTAVQLEDRVVVEREEEEYAFLAVVTAGVGNAVDISQRTASDEIRQIGTINTMLFIDGHLTDGAFVNAIMSATEAKTKALHDLDILDPQTKTPATGTSTDALLIAATQQGEATPYAGSGTALGKGSGRIVHEATTLAIEKYLRRVRNKGGAEAGNRMDSRE